MDLIRISIVRDNDRRPLICFATSNQPVLEIANEYLRREPHGMAYAIATIKQNVNTKLAAKIVTLQMLGRIAEHLRTSNKKTGRAVKRDR